jgi:pimeloyl-ACP methyl ester carboxylesterase
LLDLRDGRRMEFAQCGDPAGLPVFFFHGFIGSYHQALVAHEPALRHGLRVIAPNRPGVGRSSPRPRRTIAESVSDVQEIADSLGVRTFGVIGASGGGPYALACLARLPQRVKHATIVSGLGPIGEARVLASMNPFARRVLRVARRFPFVVQWAFAARLRAFSQGPEQFLDALLRRWSRSDRELMSRPAFREMFLSDLQAVLVTGQGAEGMAQELQLYFRWGFRLSEIPREARVTFWHGRSDHLVPALMSQEMARQLPRASVELRAGGHFMVVDCADEVLGRARELAG